MTEPDLQRDRVAAGALAAGGVVCSVLAVGAGTVTPALYLAVALFLGAVFACWHVFPRRPYAHWPAWLAGAAIAVLLAQPHTGLFRVLPLSLAAVEAAVGVVLALAWYRRRGGRGDWLVWRPEEELVLRREWSRRAAIGWAEDFGEPCAISPADQFPEVAGRGALYPDPDRPHVRRR
ncbi:hypothetical protein [Streptomyces sp. NPDC001889]